MVFDRFDLAVKSIAAGGTRRAIVRILTLLLFGRLSLVDRAPVAARRRKPGASSRQGEASAARKRKKKKKKRCKPRAPAQTCAGRCGTVVNNCRRPVDCGSCGCEPPCPICQSCNAAARVCAPDSAQRGDVCGPPGQICQQDGRCACDASSCPACASCRDDGACAAPCDGVGCCESAACQPGTAHHACGQNGDACRVCANPTPVCASGVCVACSVNDPCPIGHYCASGDCVACDVCAAGCPFTSLQDAINDIETGPGATIVVCPGRYPQANITVNKSITIVGAGDGENEASDTILDAGGAGLVALVDVGVTATLRGLRITGGSREDQGGGMFHQGASLEMIDCTVIGNTSHDFAGGGFYVNGGALTLTRCHVTANSAGDGGGIYNNNGVVTLDESTVIENEPNNCAPVGSVANCSG